MVATKESLEAEHSRVRRYAQRLVRDQEDQARRLGEYLHDRIGGGLTALVAHLEILSRGHLGESPAHERCVSQARRLVSEVRAAHEEIYPHRILDVLGLADGLFQLVDDFRPAFEGSVQIHVSDHPILSSLSDTANHAIYRIAQESLTNVLKHASAGLVEITLSVEEETVLLEVRDDGAGNAASLKPSGASLGLLGMQERALSVGGKLTLSANEGGGVCVRFQAPALTLMTSGSGTNSR